MYEYASLIHPADRTHSYEYLGTIVYTPELQLEDWGPNHHGPLYRCTGLRAMREVPNFLHWCQDHAPRRNQPGASWVAAIGILSHGPRREFRMAIRQTWLPDLPTDVAAHFVLRSTSLDASAISHSLATEARQHDDIVWVDGPADLQRTESRRPQRSLRPRFSVHRSVRRDWLVTCFLDPSR